MGLVNLLIFLSFFSGVAVSRLEYSSAYVISVIATKASSINIHTHTHTQSPSQDTDPTKLFLSFEGIYDAEKSKGVVFLAAKELAMRSV
jgi:hypothetical protein